MTRALLLAAAAAVLVAAGSPAATTTARPILTVAVDGTDLRILAEQGGHPVQASDGRIAYFAPGGLWVMAPDGSGKRAIADAGPIEDYHMETAWSARGEIGFGRWDGSTCGPGTGWGCATAVLMAVDAATGAVREVARSQPYGAGSFSWAPRGDRVAYVGEYDPRGSRMHKTLEIVRADGAGRRVLLRMGTRAGSGLFEPAWSPRGDWISFRRIVDRRSDSLWLIRPKGGLPKKLVHGRSSRWSPSGDRLLYVTGHRVRTIDVRTGRVRELARAVEISDVAWSPDGRRVAYATPSHVRVIRASDGRVVSTPIRTGVWSLFFTTDGTRLVYTLPPPTA